MNTHQLRIFLTVAQRRSISATARELFLSQPAVSLQLRSLERTLGVQLFHRSRKAVTLTDAGEALLEAATTIVHAEDEALRVLDELRGASKGKLLLGTNTTGGMYLLPRIVRAFRTVHPDIEIVLDVDTTDAIVERVALNALDLGFVGGPIVDRRLTVEAVVDDPLALIASPDCPLVRQDRVLVQDLAACRLIVPEPQSRTRRLVEQHLREAGLTLRPSLQMVGTEAVKKAVEANLGIAFVSSFAIGPEVAHGILCRLEPSDLKIVRQLELIFRSHRYVSPAAKGFRRFLRERAHQLSVEQQTSTQTTPQRDTAQTSADSDR